VIGLFFAWQSRVKPAPAADPIETLDAIKTNQA
jgi:hypothetical protein